MSRTLHDWLRHARETDDATEIAQCLDAATALVESCSDWRSILACVVALEGATRERIAHVADRTLDAAKSERDVWGFRDVAQARATKLGDEEGARAALEACSATFLTLRTDVLGQAAAVLGTQEFARGYEWVLLGQGFVELGDENGRRRCLQEGRDMARRQKNAADLCDVAKAWAENVDRAEGIALLREAEAMPGEEVMRAWSFANAWSAIDEAGEARRVLESALAEASSCEAALHVTRAWVSQGDVDRAREALHRAMARAENARDWLAIAEMARDHALGDVLAADALKNAEALAKEESEKASVSRAYGRSGDEVGASRVGARGVRPEVMCRHARTLDGWASSASALFDWMRARMTTELLERIAHADYGMDAEKHSWALRDICATGLVPRDLPWEPHEVLALTRWGEGEQIDHLERGFCAMLLCVSPSDIDELVVNGIILAESCLALGGEAAALAEQFFAWRSECDAPGQVADEDDVDPESQTALLLLFVVRAATAPDDPRLEALSRKLTESPPYTLGTIAEWIGDSMRPKLWKAMLERHLFPRLVTHPPIARVLEGLDGVI